MAKYIWKSPSLKKRNKSFGYVAFGAMLLALATFQFISGDMGGLFSIGFMGVAVLCLMISWKAQSDDRKLKR